MPIRKLSDSMIVFRSSTRATIVTTRFNKNTWMENVEYRKHRPHIGCIYSTPHIIAESIAPDTILFVLEMNNDTNNIEGIGMIRNRGTYHTHPIYSKDAYNQLVYIGKYHLSREKLDCVIGKEMAEFDKMCFKGYRHQKRLMGIKTFPIDMIYHYNETYKINLIDVIRQLFENEIKRQTICTK
jgi:hypothetical protein